jgi:hypothetical protein
LWISRPFVDADRRRAFPCSSARIPGRLLRQWFFSTAVRDRPAWDRCNRLFHVDHACLSQTNDEYDGNRYGCENGERSFYSGSPRALP